METRENSSENFHSSSRLLPAEACSPGRSPSYVHSGGSGQVRCASCCPRAILLYFSTTGFLRRMAAPRHIGGLDCVPGERLTGKES